MKKLISLIFLIHFFYTSAVNIAITIDDHPLPSGLFKNDERTLRLIAACEKHGIKAAFFCIGKNCKENDAVLLKVVDNAGHFLANHTFNHQHFSEYPLEQFEKELQKTEALLKPYKQWRTWFRYPFLDYGCLEDFGGTQEKMVASYELLKRMGYKEGYVSIYTYDWYIDGKLQEALKNGKKVDFDNLRKMYLLLIKQWCNHFIDLYEEKGLNVTHTILLHSNDINGLFLDDLLTMIKELGWNIVSPEEAFENKTWQVENSILATDKPIALGLNYIDDLLKQFELFT